MISSSDGMWRASGSLLIHEVGMPGHTFLSRKNKCSKHTSDAYLEWRRWDVHTLTSARTCICRACVDK